MEKVLGDFEQLVLLSLMRLSRHDGDPYGVSICDDITARTGRDVSLGAVYKTLERLEDKGLVTSRYGDPTPVRGGRPKRYFKTRPVAVQAVRQSLARIKTMTAGLESMLKLP